MKRKDEWESPEMQKEKGKKERRGGKDRNEGEKGGKGSSRNRRVGARKDGREDGRGTKDWE